WHGGWCWRRVADRLQEKGHKVFAPTLTGVGERSHLLNKDINLDTHITDIVNVVKWEDLKDVCLVVHSYGGWPGSGALERIGERVSSIVWLDAFKPENGQRGPTTSPSSAERHCRRQLQRANPHVWRQKPRHSRSMKRTVPGLIRRRRRSRTAWFSSRSS